MSRAARSVFIFGLYLIVFGGTVLVAPNAVLGVMGLQPTAEPWLRVAGMFMVFFGYYYCRAARAEMRAFLRWTVEVRLAVPFVFAALVATHVAPWLLLPFGFVDAAAALWTAWCLQPRTA